MELDSYLNKRVKIELLNSFFFEGTVIKVNEDSIVIIDRRNQKVTIQNNSIMIVREVLE